MKTIHTHRPRTAFTLVELLVVIAIIGILVSLTTVAVFSVLRQMTEARTSHDINQMSTAVGAFRDRFKVYPPSRIILYPNRNSYDPANPDHVESLYWLDKIWPRIGNFGVAPLPSVDWAGGLPCPIPAVLEGDQCLVFFLGGIPYADATGAKGCLGFSTSPTNPAAKTTDRIGPFYTFEAKRLYTRSDHPFFSYADQHSHPVMPPYTYTRPYAYFSSGRVKNGYNPAHCLGINSKPYFQPGPAALKRYHNETTFQLIGCGKDQLFGGDLWNPAIPADAAGSYNPTSAVPISAYDDRTNFCANNLGVGN